MCGRLRAINVIEMSRGSGASNPWSPCVTSMYIYTWIPYMMGYIHVCDILSGVIMSYKVQ